ncbi:WW domain-containing protein [Sphaceloma murrayae]|uniref:WW domain-containing protein n=1 Tax=Sphaceloma murrayae TaxID=2082308 RepID=A0A2K1QRN4_9PEZI|nr:WW domain-containing protein [Sphaceloma murrayae]
MDGDRYGSRPHDNYYPPPPMAGDAPESPTVGPLRISKAASPVPSAAYQQSPPDPAAGSVRTTTPGSSSGRKRFSADDPNRPSVSGYASSGGRGGTPKPLPDSPGPDTPLKDERGPAYPTTGPGSSGTPIPAPENYLPRPVDTTVSQLSVPAPQGVNRMTTNASTYTTRAERGSPPPPETPVDGVPATGRLPQTTPPTTSAIQAQTGAAAQRASPYAAAATRPSQTTPQPQFYPQQGTYAPPQQGLPAQGAPQQASPSLPPLGVNAPYQTQQPALVPTGPTASQGQQQVVSGQAMQGLSIADEPPPAYTAGPYPQPAAATAQGYPDEKRPQPSAAGNAIPISQAQAQAQAQSQYQAHEPPRQTIHPAYANATSSTSPSHPAAAGLAPVQLGQPQITTSIAPGPSSPPPLPEGWIAHLDQNSGQYYYIHLPTQSTQWEFPKGPTPLSMQEPMSPAGGYANTIASPAFSHFPSKPLMSPAYPSPGFPPHQRPYQESLAGVASPTAGVFSGPPPAAGVDMYKVAPSNGVYFGPYLRYTNVDLERSLWLGSILIITDTPQPPTIHIHQSTDLSPNPRQLKANPIYSHQRWLFYRYDIDLLMEDHACKWTYAITSHLGCTRYEFLVAGRHETNWRFITHSGNDFALGVSASERARVGGVGLMWKDVLQKHQECGGFHAQLGLGGQIYADRLWQDVPMLKQWTTVSGKENRKNAPWTPKHEEDVIHAFFHFYTSHFDQPHLREAFAQIPHVLTLDDHDIFDGYGSYPDYMQHSNMFKNIGRIGTDMYLLFQHHTTHEILRNVSNDLDLFTITGTGWHFLKYLGPAVVVVGPDTRSERTMTQVMAGPTYQGLFPKVAMLPPSVQHCIWMFPVPLIYPRLHSANQIANTVTQGKKAVTGTFNMLGKVTSSVAGIVGAKEVVNDGFHSVKKAVGKSGLMSGMLSPFGEFDVLDELRDLWTHESKDIERTYIIRTLQGISHNKSLRMTFLSGSVNCAGAGIVHDPQHPGDHKTMYQLISSAIVNAPPPGMVLRLLNTNPKHQIYIPQNGVRSSYASATPAQATDTKEDMMEIFVADPDGRARDMKRLMGRRNYVAMVAYDPAMVQGVFSPGSQGGPQGGSPVGGGLDGKAGGGAGRLSLAADFLVQQTDGGYSGSVKYGPVVIPSLEYGR